MGLAGFNHAEGVRQEGLSPVDPPANNTGYSIKSYESDRKPSDLTYPLKNGERKGKRTLKNRPQPRKIAPLSQRRRDQQEFEGSPLTTSVSEKTPRTELCFQGKNLVEGRVLKLGLCRPEGNDDDARGTATKQKMTLKLLQHTR